MNQKEQISNLRAQYNSPEQLQREVNYHKAQRISEKMLDLGLLTEEQFQKLTQLNRETFKPFLAGVME